MADITSVVVYGSGCKKCKQLHVSAEAAVKQAGLSVEVEYVTDIMAIAAAGIMSTPALSINGRIVSTGKVLSEDAVVALLAQAAE